MKERVNMRATGHDLHKQNIITITSKGGAHDVYKCTKCGATGKRYGLSDTLELTGPADKMKQCIYTPPSLVGRRLQVTRCTATGPQFANLTPGSQHTIVEPPVEYRNSTTPGAWVQGIGEPVKLLENEYILL